MPLRNIAKELTLLLGLALLAAFTINFLSPKGIALFGEWDTSKGVITPRSKDDVVVHDLEIQDVKVVKEIYESGKALFLDARSRDLYKDGHIKGAISLPVGQSEQLIDSFRETYPTSQLIITYCTGRECDDSHELAHHLFDAGYTNVSVFIDGYPAWEEEGYPIE